MKAIRLNCHLNQSYHRLSLNSLTVPFFAQISEKWHKEKRGAHIRPKWPISDVCVRLAVSSAPLIATYPGYVAIKGAENTLSYAF